MAKHNNLTEFLKRHPGKFMVDSYYTDFFGWAKTLKNNVTFLANFFIAVYTRHYI
jgi:hypothetical protein